VPVYKAGQVFFRKTMARRTVLVLVTLFMLAQVGSLAMPGQRVLAETVIERTGAICVGTANIRSGPTTSDTIIDTLYSGHAVYVIASTTGQVISGYGADWYRIRFTGTSGSEIEGFVVGGFVEIDPLPEPDPEPDPTFEALMDQSGFPESYRPGLRRLHARFPAWNFQALQTGLDWADAVEGMHTPGYTLIPNTMDDNWKSLDVESYNWLTNTWSPYDGSTWMMCSRSLIAYFMDPRNMMGESNIFQFEILNFQSDVHTEAGVEAILRSSFMGSTSFQYIDPDTGAEQMITYAGAFMKAGQAYNISPYHLAARSLIEVGSSGSASVTGHFSAALAAAGQPVTYEFDGCYNFYNIGGNVRNGLEYARYGPDRKAEQTAADTERLIPWNSRYRSILGGSLIIGNGYINAGQNTLYLQKFDVDNSDNRLYWHIYMGNILAPTSEGAKLYKAYSEMGDLQKPITFLLPVFLNMPETACPRPAESGNPNNWLNSLSISGYSLTPTFDPAVTGEYTLIVEHTVSSVQISGSPVTSLASVSGTGARLLDYGKNLVNIVVTAQNGDLRIYALAIVRKYDPSLPTPTPNPNLSPSPSPAPISNPSSAPSPVPTSAPANPVPTSAPPPTSSPTPDPADGAPAITSSTFNISGSCISGLNLADGQNNTANLLAGLAAPEGCTLNILNPDGTQAADLVGTGSQVQVLLQGVVQRTYTVLLYGDVNGNGKINSSDLNTLFLHVLGSKTVDSIYQLAADANHNGKVNSADLNTIFQHVLGQLTINQP
jgi:beta-N-acetylglucosaminidase